MLLKLFDLGYYKTSGDVTEIFWTRELQDEALVLFGHAIVHIGTALQSSEQGDEQTEIKFYAIHSCSELTY